jgi:hypothetical protein
MAGRESAKPSSGCNCRPNARRGDKLPRNGWPAISTGAALLAFGFDQRDFPGGDLTQGRDDFLVVRLDQRPGTLQQLLGTARCSEYQFEPIRDVFEAIFYSYSGHRNLIFRPRAAIVNEGANAAGASK